MHQLHKCLTGAANSSIEIIIAWSELLQMRKKLDPKAFKVSLYSGWVLPGRGSSVQPDDPPDDPSAVLQHDGNAGDRHHPVGAMPEQHPQYNEQIVQRNGVYSACQQL